jgi:hypothetical protein
MIHGDIEIPNVQSDDDLNFDDLFQADQNDLIKMLDPETAKKIERS